jgi:proline racemase
MPKPFRPCRPPLTDLLSERMTVVTPSLATLPPTNGYRTIRSVETHCGPHVQVVFGGEGDLDIPGDTMFEKKTFLEQHRDWIRTLLLQEPRGAYTSNVDLILPSPDPRADAGFVIMEQSPYYPPMSGGNLICVVTALLETGALPMREPDTTLTLDTPAGLVTAQAQCAGGRVLGVTFTSQPAFVTHLDAEVEVPGIGTLAVDVAYGGMFYLLVEASAVGLPIDLDHAADLATVGEAVKQAAREQIEVVHPENPQINFLENVLWYEPAKDPANDGRNTVVVSIATGDPANPDSTGAFLDRSPCGTGTCARLAVLHARGQLGVGEDYRHEGIMDIVWTGRIAGTTEVTGLPAVVPQVTGRGWVTGIMEHIIHDDDPFPAGFVLPDR